ncbi:MAG TPA: ScpA family protein [Acidimicrobiales bacterium]|nr:ScpA family protein [Acidimicrobiales bacterium]
MAYEVTTEVFEGPFDVLLRLITAEQVDLYEVSIARIVDGFLAELERMESLDLEVATEFLLIAATLVELKSRRLLPGLDDGELDEELGLWEERDLLLARLLECKTFKDAAAALSRLADSAARSWARRVGPDERFLSVQPDLLEGITPEKLRDAFRRAVAPKPVPKVSLEHVAASRISVRQAVAELVDELPRTGPITFRRLTASLTERAEVVVRFLALLELYKQGMIELDQTERLGELRISWLGADAALMEELAVEEYRG